MAIYSLEVERHCLGGLIKHPNVYAEISPYVDERDFYDDIHSTLYLIIKACADKGESWNKVTIAQKIQNLGITFKNELDIFEYVDSISFPPITFHGSIEATKELKKLRIRRDLEDTANKIQEFVKQNGNLSLDEIVGGVDAIYGEKVSIYNPDDAPENLYEGLNDMVEERGNNPVEETGLKTPYEEFNKLFGGFKPGNIYAFASRPAQGKSTLLEDVGLKSAMINGTKAFVCDTEMNTKDIKWRSAAARSLVGQWHLETGNWRKNQEMIDKFRASKALNEEYAKQQYVYHYHVGNKNLDQIMSIIRRWQHKNIKPGQVPIVVYDYLKLTASDNIDGNWKEYQLLGQNIDRLKRLAEELNLVILTAIQLNRSGENFNRQSKDVMDDSASISISDRLQWFASFVAIFRRKTIDEYNLDGANFGTHKMIPLKTRFQGREAAGHHDLVKRQMQDGEIKWVNNYLNFRVENFNVTELGSLKTILATKNNHDVPAAPNLNDGPTL